MTRINNFAARLTALEKAAAARKQTGLLKLTYPDGAPLTFHVSDTAAIAEARAAGRRVFVADEPLPPGGVIM
jgi:hypothetical protein